MATVQQMVDGKNCADAENTDGTTNYANIAASWNFIYDGDGNRVQQEYFEGNFGTDVSVKVTSYFAGGSYERQDSGVVQSDGTISIAGTVTRKYYSFGGQPVAMIECSSQGCGDGLQYFLTDHLGSVVAVLDDNGNVLSQQRYLPFGQVRTDVGNIAQQTDFSFTGQRSLDAQGNSYSIGLMDFKFRMMDPYLGRFISPDTITPGGPQGLNRYSYGLNNPSRFTDPSGHKACDEIDADGRCITYPGGDSRATAIPPDPTCAQGTKKGSYKGDPSENPSVSDQDVQAMAVFMYYEYSGYYLYNGDRSNIPWDIVLAKFWVFYNLVFSRRDYINHGVGIYNSSNERIATWNPYIAVAGHEAPVKAALINILPGGFSASSYDEQYKQILNEAARLNNDPVYSNMLGIALGVRDKWNKYGTGSSADPSHGSVSFADFAANDPTGGPQWVCTTHPFVFEPGIRGYSILDDIDGK